MPELTLTKQYMACSIFRSPAQTEIRFTDATGNILHSKQLGAQASGLVGFSWENIPTEVVDIMNR